MQMMLWVALIAMVVILGLTGLIGARRVAPGHRGRVLLGGCAALALIAGLMEMNRAEANLIPVPGPPSAVPAPAPPPPAPPAVRSAGAARIAATLGRLAPDSPLRGHEQVMVAAGRAHGVRPELIAAIAGMESGFGRTGAAPAGHNAWGMMRTSRGFFTYPSWPAGIWAAARLLGGPLYAGDRRHHLTQIAARWCPPGARNDVHGTNHLWPAGVAEFLGTMGVPPGAQLTGLRR